MVFILKKQNGGCEWVHSTQYKRHLPATLLEHHRQTEHFQNVWADDLNDDENDDDHCKVHVPPVPSTHSPPSACPDWHHSLKIEKQMAKWPFGLGSYTCEPSMYIYTDTGLVVELCPQVMKFQPEKSLPEMFCRSYFGTSWSQSINRS